jgi:hypothetical protein
MRNWIFFISVVLLVGGCISPKVSSQQSAKIVWKSSSLRYADMGFISDSGDSLEVEIYGVGSPLMRLSIGSDTICRAKLECISHREFYTKELSSYYPKGLLENIFRAEAIYGGLNLTQNSNGFTQNIKKSNLYEIEYKVSTKQTIFRDTINKILIKVIKI